MTKYCPYCDTESQAIFTTRDLNKRISKKSFTYNRCPGCKLIFLDQIPQDLGRYYPLNYYDLPATLADLEKTAENERFKLNLLTPFISRGKLLEIGPAFGNFAFLAKRAGFDVEVIEMDSRCCKFLRETAGIKTIQNENTIQAVQGRGPYDVITLWHVVEHLSDFKSTLEALAAEVRPGGFMLIAAPNPEALQFKIFGRYWTHVDAPRHVVLIPVNLLIHHLKSLGFTPVTTTMTDPGGLGWNDFGWQVSLSNLVHTHRFKRALTFLAKMLTKIMRIFERNDSKGTAYTLIFKKEI